MNFHPIENDRQYKITKHWRATFAEALESLEESVRLGLAETTPLVTDAHRGGLLYIIELLDKEIEDYEQRIVVAD